MTKLLSVVLSVVTVSGVGATYYATSQAQEKIEMSLDKVRIAISPFGQLNYGKVKVNPIGPKLEIHDLSFSPNDNPTTKMQAKKLVVDQLDLKSLSEIAMGKQSLSRSARITFHGIKVPTASMKPDMKAYFEKMGLAELSLSTSIGCLFEPEKELFHLTDFWIQERNLGKIGLQMTLAHVPFPTEAEVAALSDPHANAAVYMKYIAAAIKSISIKYEDKSLLSRMRYASYVIYQKDPVESLRSELAGRTIASDENKTLDQQLFEKKWRDGMLMFLNEPKTLELKSTPEKPLGFLEFAAFNSLTPEQILEKFNVHLIVNGKKI